jgi:hypothetical protein
VKASENVNKVSGALLESRLAAKLRDLLEEVGWLQGWSVEVNPAPFDHVFDIRAHIPLLHGNSAELWVECKELPRPSRFPYVKLQNHFSEGKRSTRVPVLAAPFISPRMAELCQKHGWSWFDLAGNCQLNVPNVFLIERTGKHPVHESPMPQVNLGTREAGRVVRTLLAAPNATRRWTQRDLAQQCTPRVSIGLVNKVVAYLREQAFLEHHTEGGFNLYDPVGLLVAWREAYRFDRHQRQGYFTIKQGRKLHETLSLLDASSRGYVAYGVFSSAEFQAPHVRQPKIWLYAAAEQLELVAKALEAKLVDSGENLVVLIPDDLGVFAWREAKEGSLACTNPVQTYVDVFQSGGRGQEAAEALLEQNLKPAWRTCGLNL